MEELPHAILLRQLAESDLACRDLRLASAKNPELAPLLDRAERLQATTDELRKQLGLKAVRTTPRPTETVHLPEPSDQNL